MGLGTLTARKVRARLPQCHRHGCAKLAVWKVLDAYGDPVGKYCDKHSDQVLAEQNQDQ